MVNHVKKEHIDIFLVYGISVCIIIIFSIVKLFSSHEINQKSVVTSNNITSQQSDIFDPQAFNGVNIEGKAYVVYDLVTHKVISSKNETKILPLASMTKIMTAVSATLHKPKEEKIIITQKSIEAGYDLGLKNKQVWELSELLKYTLVFSSNDGAEAIADGFGGKDFFIKQMNNDAKDLSLNLVFTDPAGRDLNGEIGGLGSALDVAKLISIARKIIPEVLDATTKKRQTVFAGNLRISGIPNTNQEIEDLSGAEASKTGYTDMAGGNLVIVVDISIGHPVAIVVMGSTREGRFRDVKILYKALRKSIGDTVENK